jgi:diaminopimelate epimerase
MPIGADVVRVVKMNGTRNDFIVLDERVAQVSDYGAFAQRWCDRASGIGADGLLVLLPPTDRGLATMRIFNADGGEAEMCGNGIRCIARYLWEEGSGDRFVIDTANGPIAVDVSERDGEVLVRVDLGMAELLHRYADGASVEGLGRAWRYGQVSLGNPHAVVFVDDPDSVDLERLGAELQSNPAFPQGINLHLASVQSDGSLRVRHFERGVGITKACGTGAGAAAIIAIDEGRVQTPVSLHVPGGVLGVDWRPGERAILWGNAEVEFERTLEHSSH